MKFIPGPLASAMSGSLGGTVASRNKGGPYFRGRAVPITSTTEDAMAAKARLGGQSTAWVAETAANRAAWLAWSAANPFTDKLGMQRVIPANAAYISVNTRLVQHGFPTLSEPPIAPAPQPLLTLVQSADIGTGTFDLTFTPTPLQATEYLRIRAFVTESQAINFVENNLRVVGISGAAEPSPFDHQSLVEAKFGTLTVGDTVHVFAAVFDSATGLISNELRQSTLVTDTV